MNKLYLFSILLLAALAITSCGDADPEASVKNEVDKIAEELKETVDSETDKNIETVITTDEEGNQMVTKIETKEDGTQVKTTVEATAEEIREIVEKGELLEETKLTDGGNSTEAGTTDPIEEEDTYDFHAYEKLNSLLSTYVSYAGNVNYSGIKSNKSKLDDIIKEFESNFPGSDWSSAQKLTFWINAYNLYTIKLIVDNYPTTSITKITAKPWHKKFIKLNGSTYSLNQIENEIIRKRFNEPRIHFALNCASKSCPVLLNKAYTPGTVYGKMTAQTKRFLNDKSKNTFGDKEVQISKIFDWYGEDFTKGGKTVFDFINKYRTEQLDKQKITYQEYSWDLNK
ncbi:MAG: DUF547 domain-containing protein [Crocinitomicaceae bacterium]|nr:DUF547 domain-containing protein [Crocinitomicaceae bacterium]